ncbi:MAG TPA: CPBP family intramembrane glutamic endopeptidase [Planctomycetota bacterium]
MKTPLSPGPVCVAPNDLRVVVVGSLHAAIALTLLEYFARPEFFARHFPGASSHHFGLYPHLWWALWTIVLFLVVPAVLVRAVYRHRLRDYGLTLAIERRHWWLYLALFAAVLPIVLYAGSRSDFQAVYPFYRGALNATTGAIVAWEVAYLLQFLALEFFFRGFLVLGMGRVIGRASIWVAMVPYCMLHYHKPPAEAFAAIVAGVVLGEVAFRTRSIAGGAILHIGVAATMELLAILRV